MKLGEILKELLFLHDMTQKQLAEALDLSPSALGNYIQGSREPDYGTLIRIADYFHVTTDFLLNHSQKSRISHEEELLIHTFRSLTREQQEFYLEQGQIFIRQNRKKESSDSSPARQKDRGVS
ncbi:MAG: helix-turn-helix transcriptional regulator [Lachnospiraceae bacterium]|nr:helix-turn-helix transcriptional regulator [Lachnospiraceae bacterium]